MLPVSVQPMRLVRRGTGWQLFRWGFSRCTLRSPMRPQGRGLRGPACRVVAVLLAAGFILGAAAPASADRKQIVVGQGRHPSVAVTSDRDAGIRAHIVWGAPSGSDPAAPDDAIGYCRWRLGAGGCELRKILLPLGSAGSFSAPEIHRVLPPVRRGAVGGKQTLIITDGRCCGTEVSGRWMLISRDFGNTWAASRVSLLGRGSFGVRRAGLLELVHPEQPAGILGQDPTADDGPALTTVGGSTFSFGLPVELDHVPDLYAPPPLAEDFPAFTALPGSDRTVYADALGILSDGRPFAVGYASDAMGRDAFIRTARSANGSRDTAGGWTPWAPLNLPRDTRDNASTDIEGVATANVPALLVRELTTEEVLWAVLIRGGRAAERQLVAGVTGSPVSDFNMAALAASGNFAAAWVSQQEGCPRGRRCLIARATTRDAAARPLWTTSKDIIRSVPIGGPLIGAPEIALADGVGAVTWTERQAQGGALPEVRVGQLCGKEIVTGTGCFDHERRLDARKPEIAQLYAPDLVAGTSFTARLTGRRLRSAIFTLSPPACRPPRTGDTCQALRRRVVITGSRGRRRTSPFAARFTGLPALRGVSTSAPTKNRRCGVDAYLYQLRAVVRFDNGRRTTVSRNLSVCPPVR